MVIRVPTAQSCLPGIIGDKPVPADYDGDAKILALCDPVPVKHIIGFRQSKRHSVIPCDFNDIVFNLLNFFKSSSRAEENATFAFLSAFLI